MQPNWTENDVMVNGRRVHYTRTGNGSQQALVLVHGFSDNGLCWAKTAQLLEGRFDIIMPDSRGHGLSARVQPGEEVDNAGDLAAFIQFLELDHPIVAGHSMGAASASELGARFPEIPSALILEDPPWRISQPVAQQPQGEPRANPMADWAKTLVGKSLDTLVAEYEPEHPTWDADVLRAWCLGKVQLDQNFLTTPRLFRMDWQDIVCGLTCPTLLITADAPGGIVTDETAEQAVAMNKAHFSCAYFRYRASYPF